MRIIFNDKKFLKDMNNLVKYAEGFLDGVQMGKPDLLKNVGIEVREMLNEYIDTVARMDPASLHHVYEWQQTGSPDARLYDVSYMVSGRGISFDYTLSQSTSVKEGSSVPFYDKARIMEQGIPVTIRPKSAQVLSFDVNGKQVFTPNPVNVSNPGGEMTVSALQNTIKEFFSRYLSQTFLSASGIGYNLRNPVDFKKNLSAGRSGGRSVGVRVGKAWIAKGAI